MIVPVTGTVFVLSVTTTFVNVISKMLSAMTYPAFDAIASVDERNSKSGLVQPFLTRQRHKLNRVCRNPHETGHRRGWLASFQPETKQVLFSTSGAAAAHAVRGRSDFLRQSHLYATLRGSVGAAAFLCFPLRGRLIGRHGNPS